MYFFQWIAIHWQVVCGWLTGLYILARYGRALTNLILSVNSIVLRFENAERTLGLLATNHLPHIQAELEKNNVLMASMDDTLKKIYDRQTEENE